jgi:DNA-binding transcriptional LysR family regulator
MELEVTSESELAFFVEVVNRNGFSAAAKAMSITRSAMSRRIERLEERLGVRLLDRTTRRIALTEAGTLLYENAQRILEEIGRAEAEVHSFQAEPKGILRIASPVMIGLHIVIPCVRAFLEAYGNIKIEIAVSDGDDFDPALFDVVIAYGPQPDSSLVGRRVAARRRVICAAPSYVERCGEPRTPDELPAHNCILLTRWGRDANVWGFHHGETTRTVAVRGNLALNDGDAYYQAVKEGIGIGRLTDLRVRADVEAGLLVPLLPDFQMREEIPIYVLHRSRRHVPPKVLAFTRFIGDFLAAPDAAPGEMP